MHRIEATVQLAGCAVTLLSQSESGPFRRDHRLPDPVISYIPRRAREAAVGCLTDPSTHRRFHDVGCAVVIPPSTTIHMVSPGHKDRKLLACQFDRDHFARYVGTLAACSEAEASRLLQVDNARIVHHLARMHGELSRPRPDSGLLLEGLSKVLLSDLQRHFELVRPFRRSGMLAPWQRNKIERHLDEVEAQPRLAVLAQLCGIGPRQLMRSFKASYGCTVARYVQERALIRASEYLVTSHLPVAAIAQRLGFGSASGFSASFRERFGETPSHFRRRALG